MIEWLVSGALQKRLVVAMICVFVAAYGYYSWTQLAVEAYPDIADASSQVVTQAPGLAAEEVEQQVTISLERELKLPHSHFSVCLQRRSFISPYKCHGWPSR
jgi:cobalt-zinc-cadmium resistance protein CzcA